MTPTFNKIMSIVRKTGDKCIIFDPTSDQAYVVMDLSSYEGLISEKKINPEPALTDFSTIDKIEPDTSFEGFRVQEEKSDFDSFPDTDDEDTLEEERFYLEPVE